jgi:protein-L-isoaspartate(D-aspartate) O-methyltransferase
MQRNYGKTAAEATPHATRDLMPDYQSRRVMMVDTQVRPNDVTKFPIIEAMLSVPREVYVPPALGEAAYVGENLALGAGRVLFEPRTLAKMLDAVDIGPADRVLIVGAGLGYSAAVVARMAGPVVAVEEDADLAAGAEARLAAQGIATVTLRRGPLAAGAPADGPFDVIVIEGAVEQVPAALLAQLGAGGRVGAVFMDAALGVCRVGLSSGGGVSWRFAFNAAAPVLAGFARQRAFTL